MTRLLRRVLSALRRPPAPEPPTPSRVIPVYIGGKSYTLEIYEES